MAEVHSSLHYIGVGALIAVLLMPVWLKLMAIGISLVWPDGTERHDRKIAKMLRREGIRHG